MTGAGQSGESTSEETEHEQHIQDLKQYRRRLDGAMFAGDLAWWEMDIETGDVTFHENKADMLGFSPADFDHHEDFTELVHPDDYERRWRRCGTISKDGLKNTTPNIGFGPLPVSIAGSTASVESPSDVMMEVQ